MENMYVLAKYIYKTKSVSKTNVGKKPSNFMTYKNKVHYYFKNVDYRGT